MATIQIPAKLSFVLVPAGVNIAVGDLPFKDSLNGIYTLSANSAGYISYNPNASLPALQRLLPGVYIVNAGQAFAADTGLISQVFTPPVAPVVVPDPTNGDVYSKNSLTPATKVEVLSVQIARKSDQEVVRTLQTPPTPRKAGVSCQVKWDGRLTPTGPVVSDPTQYFARAVASRVVGVDDFGVGNTSDTNSVGVLGAFSHAHMITPSVTYKYLTTPFNEFKPGFFRSRLNQQSWEEVPQKEWYDIRNIFDIGDLHYFEGWRTVRVFNGKIYAALVHCAQDRKFSTGVACFNESDLAWQKFAGATNMVFGLSAPYDKQVRPGLLSMRQNTTLLQDTTSVADARALAAQTEITGLAVNASFIVVARAGKGAGELCIYANNMSETLLATITNVAAPGECDFHKDGSLCVVTAGGAKVYTVAANGSLTLQRTIVTPAPDVISLACSPVADVIALKRAGQSQQTFDYTIGGTFIKAWWDAGGYLGGNILFSRTKIWNICLSPLAYNAIDRVPFGGTTGSVSFGPDGRRYDTNTGNCYVQCVLADGSLGEMVMHSDDRLLGARNLTNPREIVLNNMGFDVDDAPLVGGDPFSRPEGQRGWVPKYNYLAGQDVNAVGDPIDLRTDPTTGRTYLRMVDAAVATGGQGRARMFERMADGTLRDTGPDNYTAVYGNGGQDTTMLADGTLRSVVFGQGFYQVTERYLTSSPTALNPAYGPLTLLPPTPRDAADPGAPYPNKPYGSPTRMPDTAFGDILIGQLGQRPDLVEPYHMGFLKKTTGKFRARTWRGTTKQVGLTGRGYYPDAAPAYGGTSGTNVDSAKLINPKGVKWVNGGGYNGQRTSASDNSAQFFDEYGLFLYEYAQGSLNGGGSINQAPGSAGNPMTLLLLSVMANVVRVFYTDESDAAMGHFRRMTGFDETTYGIFDGADIYVPGGLTYGRNIFDKTKAIPNTLIRGDSGGVEGNGDFTASPNLAVVGGNPYISPSDLGQSAWYDGQNRFLGTFASTRGVAPATAVNLRVSVPNAQVSTLMILEGEFFPEDGSFIPYVTAGNTGGSTPTAAAANLFDKSNPGNVAGYYLDKNSGALIQADNWNTTYFLPVTEGLEYSASVDAANSAWFGTASATGYISSYENNHIAPAGARFLRVSTNTSLDGLMIVQGPASAVPTTYTAYGGAGNSYAASATRSYPAASSYSYETTPLVVRNSVAAFNTGASSYTISNRFFNTPGPEGWLADVYMPAGELIVFDRCVFATTTNGDMTHVTDNTRVKFTNCVFLGTGTQAPGVLRARAIFCEKPRLVTVEHCFFGNTAGCKVNNWATAGLTATDTVTWRYNRYDNIMGGTGSDYCQALQLQHVIRPGIEVAYNQVVNVPGNSRVEDNFNWGESGGTAASPMMFHDNCVRGAYETNPTQAGYSGTGQTTDAGSADVPANLQPQYIIAENNYFIGCQNACMNIAAGHHIIYRKNKCVSSGFMPDGVTKIGGIYTLVSMFRGQNYSAAQYDYNQIVDNDIFYNSANARGPYYENSLDPQVSDFRRYAGPNSKALVAGNTLNTYRDGATFADEEALWQQYVASLDTKQVQVGALV